MTGMITIENLTGRHLQFRIDHQKVCVKVGQCLCRQGRRSVEALNVHVPGSGRTDPLPPAVGLCPEIKAAANGNRPKIKIHGAEPQAKAAAAKPTKKKDGETGGSKGGTGRKGQNKKDGKTTD